MPHVEFLKCLLIFLKVQITQQQTFSLEENKSSLPSRKPPLRIFDQIRQLGKEGGERENSRKRTPFIFLS